MKNYYDFTGKVAIITGAGSRRGLGVATAEMLAGYGCNVVLSDIDQEGNIFNANKIEEANPGVKALPVETDLTSEESIKAMIQKTMDTFGRIDILVNNAGISIKHTIDQISLDEWNKVLAVNITSYFLTCREVLPIMQKQNYGRIVNVASVSGRDGGHHGGAHYVTTKAAAYGLTRHIAKAFGEYNITANAVAPGQMLTDGGGFKLEDRKPNPLCPLGRRGEAYEIAGAVAYLCSDVGNYLTGTIIDVNGGLQFTP